MNTTFAMIELFGDALGDGEDANKFRFTSVEPIWECSEEIAFDFSGVRLVTDSFANGCFGNLAIMHRDVLLRKVRLINCAPAVQGTLTAAIVRGLNSPQIVVPA